MSVQSVGIEATAGPGEGAGAVVDGEALGDAAVSVAVGRGVSEEAPPASSAPLAHPASEKARAATAPSVVTVVNERVVLM
jgi:hypothetical protein